MDLSEAQERGVSFPPCSQYAQYSSYKKHLAFCTRAGPGEGQRANRISLRYFLAGSGEGPWVALLECLAEFKKQIMHCPWSIGIPGS